MEVGKVHTWLQIGVLVGGVIWGSAKIDSRLETVEDKQVNLADKYDTIIASVSKVEQGQSDFVRALDDLSGGLLIHRYTGENEMVVVDPDGNTVKLKIAMN